jgi:hypothetical protein
MLPILHIKVAEYFYFPYTRKVECVLNEIAGYSLRDFTASTLLPLSEIS